MSDGFLEVDGDSEDSEIFPINCYNPFAGTYSEESEEESNDSEEEDKLKIEQKSQIDLQNTREFLEVNYFLIIRSVLSYLRLILTGEWI